MTWKYVSDKYTNYIFKLELYSKGMNGQIDRDKRTETDTDSQRYTEQTDGWQGGSHAGKQAGPWLAGGSKPSEILM